MGDFLVLLGAVALVPMLMAGSVIAEGGWDKVQERVEKYDKCVVEYASTVSDIKEYCKAKGN